jgi:hypothetical protein
MTKHGSTPPLGKKFVFETVVLFFFVLLHRPMLTVSLDCPFVIAASIFSIVYFPIISKLFSMID